jgi:CheY-like chemotaxis protein
VRALPFDTHICVSYKFYQTNLALRSAPTLMPATILIADDYEDNLELMRLLLAAGDYQVREARNGTECVTMAREQRPDLIMIDLSMPLLDGWAVFKELQDDERTAAIPCVAVTASGEEDRERALKNGFSEYISKPFRGAHLLETVASLLAVRKTNPPPGDVVELAVVAQDKQALRLE